MEIQTNYSLLSLNTFGIKVDGKYYTEVASVGEIAAAMKFAKEKQLPVLVLGGGSNVLFKNRFRGLVLKIDFQGISVLEKNEDEVIIKAGAGENWDAFVEYCVENNFNGLENLSLIPGNIGASPVQNIGAYGVEMKDYFKELEFYSFESGELTVFSEKDCDFGYRSSIFKNQLKGKGIVTSVTFKLSLKPSFNTGYGAINAELKKMNVKELSLDSMRKAVIQIRESKLPDPEIIGNAGSFFKNPVVSEGKFADLKKEHGDLVAYAQDNGTFKLAAGWLIDRAGWKGYRENDAGVHSKQALVLVNHGNASGKDIFDLSEKIKSSVFEKFGVELDREVNVIE